MENKITNGVYVPNENRELIPATEWVKREDATSALTVVLVTDFGALEIAKNDTPDEYDFDDAQVAAAEFGEGFRCATRHESIEMYDARFTLGLDEALKSIDGELATNSYWTCEADPDPECSSSSAFVYYGYTGYVNDYTKYYPYSVRPVSAFKK